MVKVEITRGEERLNFEVHDEVAEALEVLLSRTLLSQNFTLEAQGHCSAPPVRIQQRKPRNFEELKAWALSHQISEGDAYAFYAQCEASGWTLQSGNPVKNWKAHLAHYKAAGWLKSQQTQTNGKRY